MKKDSGKNGSDEDFCRQNSFLRFEIFEISVPLYDSWNALTRNFIESSLE